MVLFAVRPGLRLWKACSDGTVKTTLIFKDLVTKLQEGIELLDDKTRMRPGTRLEDMQFGPLKMYMVRISSVHLVKLVKSFNYLFFPLSLCA